MKVSLFTDTYADTNGVSRFIQDVADQARITGRDLQVLTSTRLAPSCPKPNVRNYRPHVARPLRKYPDQDVVWLPPAWTMIRDTVRRRPDVIHVSTPGPVGMVGVIAATILDVPITGVYHTDFPAYVRDLYGNGFLGRVADSFMRGFYRRFKAVFTRSPQYIQVLRRLGLPPDLLFDLVPGMDTEHFHPRRRREGVWDRYGLDPRVPKVLFVGRVSTEKNLPFLTAVWDQFLTLRGQADLVIVGDGPYRERMEKQLVGRAMFLGRRTGDDLADLYANSDLFLFPSVTDTLGQVVMEAQASGVPAIVSDQGGPQLTVQDGVTGWVLPTDDPLRWVHAIQDMVDQPVTRRLMGDAAHQRMQSRGFARSFQDWWDLQVATLQRHYARWNDLVGPFSVPETERDLVTA